MIFVETGTTDVYLNFAIEYYLTTVKKLAEPVLDAPPPRPRIVITALSAESPHDEQIMVAADYREATLPVGATLVVDAELHAGGAMLPLTDSFRMPLVSTDGRESCGRTYSTAFEFKIRRVDHDPVKTLGFPYFSVIL